MQIFQPLQPAFLTRGRAVTSEQFHSVLKTDLDIERLPSGKFDTNALVLGCSILAYTRISPMARSMSAFPH
ncbi:MAG: hypothetical protein DRR11_14950 [Gammaproteobacteria bacterium]|nr:MAG: hypothetical protein DRR11_14950 [Gammaproteobacteria bacterium]